jgi:CHAT domain-containing protein/tetratricopeptide (TPR) repeat protein
MVASMLATAAPATEQSARDPDPGLRNVRAWIDAGRYAEAQAEADRIHALGQTGGNGSLDVGAGDLLVEALTLNGRGAEAWTRALADQMVRAREALEPDQPSLARSVRNLGDVLFQAGEFTLATAQYERALSLRQRAGDSNDLEVAEDLDRLARALTWIERYDEAVAASNRALAAKEKILDSGDTAVARTLEVRGLLWQRRGDYPRARSDLVRALEIRETIHPAHPETAAALTLFGEQLWLEGDLVQSRQVLSRAVAVSEAALRPEHPDIAAALRSLAIPVHDLGDLAAARSLRERALAIAEKSLGPDHPMVAIQLNDLAITLRHHGEYAAARSLYERALRIYERRLGPDHTGVTTAVHNLALLNFDLGDFVEARRLQERAIKTWERVVGPEHPFVARALLVFAQPLVNHGRDREALPLYERALAIRERSLGTDHPTVARTLSYLSASLARLGQVRRASELSARAPRIWEQSSSPQPTGLSNSLLVHAKIQADQGAHDVAERSYDRVLDIQLPLYGATHPTIAETRAALAAALASLDRPEEALTEAIRSEEIGRSHLRMTLGYLPERQALEYAAQRPKGLDLALSLPSAAQAPAQVFDAVIRGRSLILDEMASRRRTLADPAAETLAPLWAALTASRQRLANLAIRGPSEQRPTQYATLLADARREKESAERALAERSVAFRSQLARAEVGIDQVRATLPPNSALVSFVRYDRSIFRVQPPAAQPASARPPSAAPSGTVPSYVAFVLRPGTSDPIFVPLGRADTIEMLIARWRNAMMSGVSRTTAAAQRDGGSLHALGTALRQRIWDPLSVHLADVSRAYVVPDGAINLIPLAALPIDRAQYLLERGPLIHYLSAERDLVSAEERSVTAGGGLLAVGGAAFSEDSLFASLASSRRTVPAGGRTRTEVDASTRPAVPTLLSPSAASFRGLRSGCASFQSMRFEALPGSGREAQEVAALWRNLAAGSAADTNPPRILTGGDAHEQAFKRLGPGRRVLHIATHGFFLGRECASALDGTRAVGGLVASSKPPTSATTRTTTGAEAPENPLLLSGLVLAGANRRAAAGPDEDDGILTSEEVASLNLEGVEWAVLSACDTGLGEVRAGEGVFGLRRAFQAAGVRTVIMSLWSVEDQATSVWMRTLYEGRLEQKLDTAEAVRHASLTVLRERRARGQSTHPFYWAAFVAAGDWH